MLYYLWTALKFVLTVLSLTIVAYVVIALVSSVTSYLLCSLLRLDVWPLLIVSAVISFIVPNAFFYLAYGRNPLFKKSVGKVKRAVMRRLKKS